MKNVLIAIVALMILAGPAMADKARDLIVEEKHLDELCRGTDNNNACIKRQKLVYQLNGLGWCYGKTDQAAYQRRWHRCGPRSWHPAPEDLHSYDR